MKTILIASRKGGAGKTTLAKNLAVAASQDGGLSMMMDMDPQGSLRERYDAREAQKPVMPARDPKPTELARTIEAARKHGVDYLFIDTPPTSEDWLLDAMKLADLVVVPVRPSPTDLRAVRTTLASARKAQAEYCFVLCQTARTKISLEAARALAQHGRLAPSDIMIRVVHAETDVSGLSAIEGGDAKAKTELAATWEFIKEVLNGQTTI
ncbi:ParA family protein [Sulfitobacter sp. D35]|uniref:ParA family protein n=1 Tax=Sulfitobacter sp. D35 TaxID=3083252 RepID=UPI00296EC42A|nr:ParA family protein [Sulfitobacter sp. D35]MDW4496556.1 ParA family protein [Sulfitobacter sp. D35]